jgi:anaphase-promoting complex subunit 3
LLCNKGYLQEARGHFSEAEAYYHQEMAVMEKVLGNKNPLYGKGMQILAELYVKEGKYQEAEKFYYKVMSTVEPYRLEGMEFYSTCLWHLKK